MVKSLFSRIYCVLLLQGVLLAPSVGWAWVDMPDYIGERVSHYQVPHNTLTVENVLSNELDRFRPGKTPILNFGFSGDDHWIKIPKNLLIQYGENSTAIMKIGYALIKDLDIYLIEDFSVKEHFKTGTRYPFAQRPINDKDFIFKISKAQQQSLDFILIRAHSTNALMLPMSIYPLEGGNLKSWNLAYLNGAIYSLMFVVALYNIIIFFSLRERFYLYYAAYLAFSSLIFATLNGEGFAFLWPSFPVFNDLSITISACGMIIMGSFFTRGFLDLPNLSPIIDRCVKTVIMVACGLIFASLLLPHDFTFATAVFAALFGPVIIAGGIVAVRAAVPMACFFLLGWSCFLTGVALYALTTLNIIPATLYTLYFKEVGFIFEILLLSLALAGRIKSLRNSSLRSLEDNLAALKSANKIKDDFLLTISHELRTPINGIIGAFGNIEHSDTPSESPNNTINEQVALGKLSSSRMLNTINDLLYQIEIRSGKLTVDESSFDLLPLINEIDDTLSAACARKGIHNHFVSNIDKPHWVSGDKYKIETVLNKLIDNAVKFTEKGGVTVNVNINELADEQLELTCQIKDTGIGISPDKQLEIFNSFYQINSSLTRGYEGLGVGLNIVKGFCDCMNAELGIESDFGAGSTFTFEITLRQTEALQEPIKEVVFKPAPVVIPENFHTSDSETPVAGTKTIMIVEDEITNQIIMQSYIKKLGYSYLLAHNGDEAVKIFKQASIDLILMDCQMPVMDGLDATKTIRQIEKNEARPSTPIIAVSANCLSEDKKKAIEAGMNLFLEKPVSLARLEETISDHLSSEQSDNEYRQSN